MTDFIVIASAIEDVLLEKVALREIDDYSIDIVPDDGRLEIHTIRYVPANEINITFTIGSKV